MRYWGGGIQYIIFLNEGITMCLEIKYYNISVRQHNLNYLFIV